MIMCVGGVRRNLQWTFSMTSTAPLYCTKDNNRDICNDTIAYSEFTVNYNICPMFRLLSSNPLALSAVWHTHQTCIIHLLMFSIRIIYPILFIAHFWFCTSIILGCTAFLFSSAIEEGCYIATEMFGKYNSLLVVVNRLMSLQMRS